MGNIGRPVEMPSKLPGKSLKLSFHMLVRDGNDNRCGDRQSLTSIRVALKSNQSSKSTYEMNAG